MPLRPRPWPEPHGTRLFNLVLQSVESYLITPTVVRYEITVPPALTVFAQLQIGSYRRQTVERRFPTVWRPWLRGNAEAISGWCPPAKNEKRPRRLSGAA
jgi:hypothetical protein